MLGFPGGSKGKESACNAGDLSSIPGPEDPLEKKMATHASILAWRIPWMEDPDGLQSIGLQSRTWLSDFTFSFVHTYSHPHPHTIQSSWEKISRNSMKILGKKQTKQTNKKKKLEVSCSISLLSTILKKKNKTCKNNWSIHTINYNLRNKKQIHEYIDIHFMKRYKSIISSKYRKMYHSCKCF